MLKTCKESAKLNIKRKLDKITLYVSPLTELYENKGVI